MPKSKSPSPAKLLSEWSKQVRARFGNRCAVCNSQLYVQAHHLLPKERYPDLKLTQENGFPLCSKHHKFGRQSAHRNPVWFAVWLKKHYRPVWDWCIATLVSLGDLKQKDVE